MSDTELIAELLLDWEERFEKGEDTPPEKLCKDAPHLVETLRGRIAILKQMGWVMKSRRDGRAPQRGGGSGSRPFEPRRDPRDATLVAGRVIGGWRLDQKIGRGAFGEVWSATSGSRRCAVKILHGSLDTPEARIRAERELEGLSRIKKVAHPLILEIYSYKVEDDRLLLVTELADQSLESAFTKFRQQFSLLQCCAYALRLLRNVAEALDFLQNHHRLLHLDIKPANLLVTDGVCKIGDFGTVFRFQPSRARSGCQAVLSMLSADAANFDQWQYSSCEAIPWNDAFRREATLFTAEGVFTPYFAPPEAFQGKNSRTFDQYSLALTFCDLVAGEIPFKGRTQYEQRRRGQMELNFLLPPLRPVIARALHPQPEQRHGSCLAFINALTAALEPLVRSDTRKNSWTGWMVMMEDAAGTRSPSKLEVIEDTFRAEGRKPRTFADVLASVARLPLTVPLGLFRFAANALDGLFWWIVSLRRHSEFTAVLYFLAVVLVCVVLVSVHHHRFGPLWPNANENKREMKDKR